MIKPFTSARSGTSSKRVTLTCSQPTTSRLPFSATNTALSPAGLRRLNRDFISLGVAGYPNSVDSIAMRAASLLFTRRILTPDSSLVLGIDYACFRRSRF
jgi:hypothetical protein